MIPCRRPDHSGTFWAMWAMVSCYEAGKWSAKVVKKFEPGLIGLLGLWESWKQEFQTANVHQFAKLEIFVRYPIILKNPINPSYIYAPKKLVCR